MPGVVQSNQGTNLDITQAYGARNVSEIKWLGMQWAPPGGRWDQGQLASRFWLCACCFCTLELTGDLALNIADAQLEGKCARGRSLLAMELNHPGPEKSDLRLLKKTFQVCQPRGPW